MKIAFFDAKAYDMESFSEINKNYGYTDEWVDFIFEELSLEEKYNALYE